MKQPTSTILGVKAKMRKLASIQRIMALDPIPGADLIEQAKVLGWSCVVLKGEFNVGDLGVFFEIDSVLPSEASYAQVVEKRKYRIRTQKMKGVISQGLMLPLWKIDDIVFDQFRSTLVEDMDVTDILGIDLYDPFPETEPGKYVDPLRLFPWFIPRTSITRFQSEPALVEEISKIPWVATEKLDGESMTLWNHEGIYGVASRKYTVLEGHRMYELGQELAKGIPDGFAVQGEFIGPDSRDNPYKLSKNQFWMFDIFDIKKQMYLSAATLHSGFYSKIGQLTNTRWGINTVPLVAEGEALTLDQIIKMTPGESFVVPGKPREGLVFRPWVEDPRRPLYKRLGAKAIDPMYLVRHQ